MKVEWAAPARANARAIARHISIDSPNAALRIVETIHTHVEGLGTYPEKGRAGRVRGTRELVIVGTPYIAVYRVRSGDVLILQVLHGAQRWPKKLR